MLTLASSLSNSNTNTNITTASLQDYFHALRSYEIIRISSEIISKYSDSIKKMNSSSSALLSFKNNFIDHCPNLFGSLSVERQNKLKEPTTTKNKELQTLLLKEIVAKNSGEVTITDRKNDILQNMSKELQKYYDVEKEYDRIKKTMKEKFGTGDIEEIKKIRNSFVVAIFVDIFVLTFIIAILYLISAYFFLHEKEETNLVVLDENENENEDEDVEANLVKIYDENTNNF